MKLGEKQENRSYGNNKTKFLNNFIKNKRLYFAVYDEVSTALSAVQLSVVRQN